MDLRPLYAVADACGGTISVTVSVPLEVPKPTENTPTFRGPEVYSHNRDCTAVWWLGRLYRFTPTQGLIVAALIDAFEEGAEYVTDAQLRELANLDRSAIAVMRKHEAYGDWIKPAGSNGLTVAV